MTVTSAEFKANLGKYLEMAASQDIFITKTTRLSARHSNPRKGKGTDRTAFPDRHLCGRTGRRYSYRAHALHTGL